MIDFKYHLVSLISVFMALGIGVALGAGPLQESIGNSLAEQVRALRADKEALQSSSRAQQDLLEDHDTYLAGAADELVRDALTGQQATIVRLQNAADADVTAVHADLQAAGAQVNGVVTINRDWADPRKSADRVEAAAAVARVVNEAAPSADASTDYLNRVLAETIGARNGAAGATERQNARAGLDQLRREGLLSSQGTPVDRSSLLVVVAGPHNVLQRPSEEDKTTDEQTQEAYLSLVKALRSQTRATVLAGPRRSTTISSLVASLRSDNEAVNAIAGVDDVDHPMGQISSVLVSRAALAGRVEQVGTAGDAKTLSPASVASSSPTPSTTR